MSTRTSKKAVVMKKSIIEGPPTSIPNIVGAWFDTVINPLLDALEVESDLLQKKNWTWQFQADGLESIRHIIGHVALDARPNLELFGQLNPEVAVLLEKHDKAVDKLSRNCAELQAALQSCSRLRELYLKYTSPKYLATIHRTVADLFGAYPQSQHTALLAQYMVNNTPDLPEYYYTAPFWNKYRKIFLMLLSMSTVRTRSTAVNAAGLQLLRDVDRLILILRKTRLRLALKYDVPPGSKSTHREEGI
jgi:hypothetical protein